MRKRFEGVQERIIECAVAEFLEKGYTQASLRSIAQKAETSTNAIYVRFHDKEGLFSAIVEPVAQEFLALALDGQNQFAAMDSGFQKEQADDYSNQEIVRLLDYIYDHFDVFRLLLDASYGTKFHNFIDQLVEMEETYTWRWLEVTGADTKMNEILPRELYHMMTTSYFEGVFEVVRHEISRERAKEFVLLMGKYHQAGFKAICEI